MAGLAELHSAEALLSSVPALTLDSRTCERGSYLIVECADSTRAMTVYELVLIADPDAELIHSVTGASEVQAFREHLADSQPASDGDLLDA